MRNTLTVTDMIEGADMRRVGARAFTFIDGLIASAAPTSLLGSAPRRLAMPGLVNAHDHVRPLSPTSFGGAAKPLETWLLRLASMPAADPYLAALAAFGRAARAGCVSVMGHYSRLHGPMAAPDEAALVARAARDVGVRATFALALRDRNPLIYDDAGPMLERLPDAARTEVERLFSATALPPAELIARAEACAVSAEGGLVSAQYGPSGVQWCSDALLEAVAEASERTGRRVHMHFLETRYQRAFADGAYPQGIVRHLKSLGLLSDRLTLAHCVYARPDELELIAESGATIVTNASSNLHLRSGIAPIGKAIGCGCRIAIGVDASAFDEDDDILRELRLAHFLHGGWGFDEIATREMFLAMIVREGRRANGAPGSGLLIAGEPGDLIVLDLEALDRDAILPVDPLDLLFARAKISCVDEVIVAGRTIARDGRLLNVDLDAAETELRARYRRDVQKQSAFLAAWPQLESAVAAHYSECVGCC